MINNKYYINLSYLFILYSLSYFFILLNYEGLYADDWTVYNQDSETINIFFDMIQLGIKGDYAKAMIIFDNQIYAFRIFTFIAYFTIGVCVYNILKTIKELNTTDIFFLTLFFLLLPVNDSRMLISISPFSFPLFLFFMSFFILTKYLSNNFLVLRFVVLGLFYLSFDTNSILLFHGIVLLYIFYIKFDFKFELTNIKLFIFKYIDFILLPILYFGVKMIFFVPWGHAEGYNSLSLGSLLGSPYYLLRNIYETLYTVMVTDIWIGLFPFLFILITIILKKTSLYEKRLSEQKILVFMLMGFVFYILGVYTYSAVGKLPNFDSLNTRHQLLTPIGISFVLYFMIVYFVNKFNWSKQIFLTIIWVFVISFIIKNIDNQFKYIKDWLYHESIMLNFKSSEIIKNNTTFIIKFNPEEKLVSGHPYAYYELNGMLKKVFGDDSRNMNYSIENIQNTEKYKQYKQYNFSSWTYSNPIYMDIKLTEMTSNAQYFKTLYYKYFKNNLYTIKIKKLTSLEFKK